MGRARSFALVGDGARAAGAAAALSWYALRELMLLRARSHCPRRAREAVRESVLALLDELRVLPFEFECGEPQYQA